MTQRMMQLLKSVGIWLGLALLSGVLMGSLSGLVEVLGFLSNRAFLLPAIFFYSFFWSAVALLLAVVLLLARLPFGRGNAETRAAVARRYLSILIPLAAFVIVGGQINRRFFPDFAAPSSLLFDAVFGVVNVLFGLWLHRRGLPGLTRVTRVGLVPLQAAVIAVSMALGGWVSAASAGGGKAGAEPAPPAAAAAGSGPNVLLIAVDALRPDHVSAYGYERQTTPNLDRLAQEGILFKRAFANSSWTKASVATIFTSLYPTTHGANVMATGVSSELETIPEVMRRHGYATGIFSANAFISPLFGYAEGVDRFHYRRPSVFTELILGHAISRLRRYSPAITGLYRFLDTLEPKFYGKSVRTDAPGLNAAFLEWVKGLQDRPFFAYFHYMEPHGSYDPPPPFDRKYDAGYSGRLMNRHPIHQRYYPFSEDHPLPSEELRNLVARYDGEVNYADEKLGELFHALKEMGLYDRTLILITADHGEEFYQHHGWGHGKSLFNDLIHVPLLVRYPEFSGGRVEERIAQHVDLMPTILEAAGIRYAGHQEGRSLVGLLKDPTAPADTPAVYSEVYHGNSNARSVIQGNLKLIHIHHYEKEAWFLFDLEKDPLEKQPLDLEQHPRTPALKKLLEEFYERAKARQVAADQVEIDPSTKEELRALGYVQ